MKPGARSERERTGLFLGGLAALLRGGVALPEALRTLREGEGRGRWAQGLAEVEREVREGHNLADALARQERWFSRVDVALVRAGLAAGDLGGALVKLARERERHRELVQRARTALTYPIIVLVLAGGLLTLLVALVIPAFEEVYRDVLAGEGVPPVTAGVLESAAWLRARGAWAAVAGLSALLLGYGVLNRTEPGREWRDRLVLRLPLIGRVTYSVSLARSCHTVGLLLRGGLPTLEVFAFAGEVAGSRRVKEALSGVRDGVAGGETVAAALAGERLMPQVLVSLARAGERTGTLAEAFEATAEYYATEGEHAVRRLSALLEPALILLLACLVGVVVVALFLPLTGLIEGLAGG